MYTRLLKGALPGMSARRMLKKAGNLIGMLLLLAVMTEVAIRYFLPQYPDPFLFDPIIGSREKPGVSVMVTDGQTHAKFANSAGFFDDEWSVKKPNGTKRIVMLGDSLTEARQVDNADDFESKLENDLRGSGIATEVLNFGVRGMGTTQEYLTLTHYAMQYNPDLVIVQCFWFNDIIENSYALNHASVRPYIVFEHGEERIVPPKDPTHKILNSFFRDNFQSYRWLVSQYFELRSSMKARLRTYAGTPVRDDGASLPFELYNPQSQATDKWQGAWRITKEMFRRIQSVAHEHGIPVLVLVIPVRYEVYPETFQAQLEQVRDTSPNAVNATYDLSFPRKKGAELFTSLSLPYIDMFDEFERRTSQGEELYMLADSHLNLHGHEVVADMLRKVILKDNMLGKN